MDLPDFTVMSDDEKKAYRQHAEAESARINKLVVARVNCPYCYVEAGTVCRIPRWQTKVPRKVSPHKARKDAWKDAGRPGWDE